MVAMNIELDNFLIFNDFKLNLSYAKKTVHSTIVDEHLHERNNFRYRKLIILMGANATGKTALSRVLMGIYNFIAKKEYSAITGYIENPSKDASFSIDLAFSDHTLYRISCRISGRSKKQLDYQSGDISVHVSSEAILKNDSYESCVSRLTAKEVIEYESYIKALEQVPSLSWKFEYPFAAEGSQRALEPVAPDYYAKVLEKTLQALDPRIEKVTKIANNESTFLIRYPNNTVLIKDGLLQEPMKLSRGTADGIGVANLITAIRLKTMEFFFCDEMFSHIHSAAEKAFLSVIIDLLHDDQQIFVTTHNEEILDMDLPLHSFAFLRRDNYDQNAISCVYASDYIKRNNVSLKNAVENDIFSSSPDTDDIFVLRDL